VREISTRKFSDIIRDGAGLELFEGSEQIGEFFRSDARRELTLSLYKQDLPVEVVEKLIQDAKSELLPYLQD
jgi:hypothetical protein